MHTNEILSAMDVMGLYPVLDAVARGSKIRYFDAEADDVRTGVVRRLTGENGSARPDDVRACYVEITDWTVTRFVPVTTLAKLALAGSFATD